ncbi:Deoxycytidylate deaminase [Gigaspora margarita]|uniref:dCMP deaminase n=1 Tax=Gigaspora margarita TaxID=4874 RepID=A0A8H4AQ39_GIGMA|nr:Deoxycytidylate deaminase [Gigaspora margarita]
MEVITSRSNCMSRKVCCIIVKEDVQVVAIGYNGTRKDDNNCIEGNCEYYNTPHESGKGCSCVHAEENALKIAERKQIGCNLYCTT